MIARLLAVALCLCVASPSLGGAARGDETATATLATYRAFVAAQPDLDAARVAPLGEAAAMMHFSLVLEIGKAAASSRLPFRVSILFVDTAEDGWRIASLLTTEDKQPSP